MKEQIDENKALYKQLRKRSCQELWAEAAIFDAATPDERQKKVSLIRAVGVVFSELGTVEEKEKARVWVRALLRDPEEKVRRYAMAALPKLGPGSAADEAELLSLLQRTTSGREQKFLGRSLDKIGGKTTLATIGSQENSFLQTTQKIKASLAREEGGSSVRLDVVPAKFKDLLIHLRGRSGLEKFVRDELLESQALAQKFTIQEVESGLVALRPLKPFTLGDLYTLRCMGSVAFVLGQVPGGSGPETVESMASLITCPIARAIMTSLTQGSARYRLDFIGKGHQRSLVRSVAVRAYELSREVLNDSHSAPWAVNVYTVGRKCSLELAPKLTEPRFLYRVEDVPAASHPPLAACMARLAGSGNGEIIWDPFCGSGLELIEKSLLGGVRTAIGTDRSAEAVRACEKNFSAAGLGAVEPRFICDDFRNYSRIEFLKPGSVDLIITNPPMGKRVPVGDLRRLIQDLFRAAAEVLRPGGRLVFANPVWAENPHPSLRLQFRQVVDFGGFDCRLEKYVKAIPALATKPIRPVNRREDRPNPTGLAPRHSNNRNNRHGCIKPASSPREERAGRGTRRGASTRTRILSPPSPSCDGGEGEKPSLMQP